MRPPLELKECVLRSMGFWIGLPSGLAIGSVIKGEFNVYESIYCVCFGGILLLSAFLVTDQIISHGIRKEKAKLSA